MAILPSLCLSRYFFDAAVRTTAMDLWKLAVSDKGREIVAAELPSFLL